MKQELQSALKNISVVLKRSPYNTMDEAIQLKIDYELVLKAIEGIEEKPVKEIKDSEITKP
jgi:hypothetical protein